MVDFSRENDVEYLRTCATLLAKEVNRLGQQVKSLSDRLGQATGDDATLQQELAFLKALLQRREQALFGDSSEKRSQENDPAEKKTKEPRRGHGPREQKQLRLIERVHELPEGERDCAVCGKQMAPMGDQTEDAEEITLIAREFVRLRHCRVKYRCSCNAHVKTAPGPVKLQAGARYSPEFAVEVASAKYLDHLPLERQVRILEREGLTVTSQTLWDQLNVLGKVLAPTHRAILAEVLKAPLLHADETPWRLMAKIGEKKKWFTWCAASSDLVGYRILDSRSKEAARQILGGYQGIVMADGYASYAALSRAGPDLFVETPTCFKLVNCWAHVRRKFVEAESDFPKPCREILDLIGELYAVEKKAAAVQGDERMALRQTLRQAHSRHILRRIWDWSDHQKVLPKSGLGMAIQYMRGLKPGLIAFLDDPQIPLDNNHGERALRGIVVGRKNHYGSRSRRGTEVAAILYSLFESAKLSGVEPKGYVIAATKAALRHPGAILLPADFARLTSPV